MIIFPYQVRIPSCTDWDTHYKLYEWCEQQFGSSNLVVTWRPAHAHRSRDPDFMVWLFVNESDATLFQLTWG